MDNVFANDEKSGSGWSVVFQDCCFLSGIVFLSAIAYLGRLGFYLDDWYLWGIARQCKGTQVASLWSCFVLDGHESRPLQTTYLAWTYHSFGAHPLPYHLLNTGDLALASIIFYLCLRELHGPRYINLVVPLVFALLPQYATDRFWIATHQAAMSVTLSLVGFLLGLKAIPARSSWPKFCCLTIASASLFACSVLAYEAMIGVLPLLILFFVLRSLQLAASGKGERTKNIAAGVILCCATTASIGMTLPYKFHAQVAFPLSQLRSSLPSPRPRIFAEIAEQVASQTVRFTALKYGIELPAAAWSLYRASGAGLSAAIPGGLIAICIFGYLIRVSRRVDPRRLNAKYAIGLILIGFVAFVFAYLPFLIWFNWNFVDLGINNRVTIGASLGAALVTVGGVVLVACSLQSPRLRLSVIGAFLAVLCGLNEICICSLGECWARARSEQVQIISEVQRNVQPLKGKTILLDGFCPRIGPATSFANDQDASPAFRTMLGDPSITVDVASFGAAFEAGYVELPAGDFGPARRYEYSENLLLYNAARNTFISITGRSAAQSYIDTADECPPHSGILSPSWHLIPRPSVVSSGNGSANAHWEGFKS